MTKDNPNVRELALYVLTEVTDRGEYSNHVLKNVLEKYQYMEKRDRAFLSRLCEGTLEQLIRIDDVLNRFSKVPVKKMKPVIRDLVMPHVENHERILEAAMKPNFGLAYEAFMNDPLVHGRISREDGEKLLKEMIQNTLDVLPEGWKKEIQ